MVLVPTNKWSVGGRIVIRNSQNNLSNRAGAVMLLPPPLTAPPFRVSVIIEPLWLSLSWPGHVNIFTVILCLSAPQVTR